jgi:hypothetical protein
MKHRADQTHNLDPRPQSFGHFMYQYEPNYKSGKETLWKPEYLSGLDNLQVSLTPPNLTNEYQEAVTYLKTQPSETRSKEWNRSYWCINLLSEDLMILHYLKENTKNNILFAGSRHSQRISDELQKDGWTFCEIPKGLFDGVEIEQATKICDENPQRFS